MRYIIRVSLFSYVSLYVTQLVVGGFRFGNNSFWILFLVVIALSLLNMLMLPIFRLMSLPDNGLGYTFLSFMLTLVIFYVLSLFVSSFSIAETAISQLSFFGIVLPSKNLTVFWSAVFSALMFSVLFNFLMWLCKK